MSVGIMRSYATAIRKDRKTKIIYTARAKVAIGIESLIDKSCMRKATYLREAASLYREMYVHKGVEVLIVRPCIREARHLYEKIYMYENLQEVIYVYEQSTETSNLPKALASRQVDLHHDT